MILLAWLVLSCNRSIDIAGYTDDEPVIFPDYREVVVPINIAPLCFSVELPGKSVLVVKGKSDSFCHTSSDGSFDIPQKQWKKLLADNAGGSIELTIC